MDESKLPIYKARLEAIRSELIGDVGKIIKTSKEEMSEPAPDMTDGAAQAYSLQFMLELGEQESQKLKQVEDTLEKIKLGDYGICINCENPIPEARLEVIPYSQHCVNCLNNIETGEKE